MACGVGSAAGRDPEELPGLSETGRLTFVESLRCVRLLPWDEDRRALISFAEAHRRDGPAAQAARSVRAVINS